MKRLFLVVTIIFVILVGIFQHSRNSDSDINYERFNLVTPGVLRTLMRDLMTLKIIRFLQII